MVLHLFGDWHNYISRKWKTIKWALLYGSSYTISSERKWAQQEREREKMANKGTKKGGNNTRNWEKETIHIHIMCMRRNQIHKTRREKKNRIHMCGSRLHTEWVLCVCIYKWMDRWIDGWYINIWYECTAKRTKRNEWKWDLIAITSNHFMYQWMESSVCATILLL